MGYSGAIISENIKLGDKRLNKRMSKIIERLVQNPEGSIPEACQTRAEIKGAYRFFSSNQFTSRQMSDGFNQDTYSRMGERKTVLMIQDTTNIDYSTHKETKGLGYLERSYNQGIKYHSSMAVSLDGLPIGIVYQKQWARNNQELGKKQYRKKTAFEEKESYRWKACIEAVEANRKEGQTFIHIADRECDIYEMICPPKYGHKNKQIIYQRTLRQGYDI